MDQFKARLIISFDLAQVQIISQSNFIIFAARKWLQDDLLLLARFMAFFFV
jgi:hypothetical protein